MTSKGNRKTSALLGKSPFIVAFLLLAALAALAQMPESSAAGRFTIALSEDNRRGAGPSAKAHTIKVAYSGDAIFKPSKGTTKQVVNAYSTATTLISSPNPSSFGQSVTFTATVTATGPYALTGKVRFQDGTTGIGTVTLNGGVGKLTKSTLAVDTHPITAEYLGDTANAKSTSSVLNQVVK